MVCFEGLKSYKSNELFDQQAHSEKPKTDKCYCSKSNSIIICCSSTSFSAAAEVWHWTIYYCPSLFNNKCDLKLFLVAKLLYNYLCPSVCPYVRPSVCPSVCLSVRFRGKRDFLSPELRYRSNFFLCRFPS